MKKPTHLILDNYSHPGIFMFWKRHGLSVMEQLVPNKFLYTTANNPLEKLIEKEIWSGWKKIILIGSPNSIRRGFNTIMSSNQECRNSLSVGFWPLNYKTLLNYFFKSSLNLRPILQVFKTGHTIYVDVPKLQFLSSKKETRYFWDYFVINSTHNSAKTTIFIDDQNFEINGKFTSRIVFHDEFLNSLTMEPSKLTKSPLLRIYLNRDISLISIKKFSEFKNFLRKNVIWTGRERLLKTGKQVEINGNWANLSLRLKEIKDTVESVHFEIDHKSLPMIIPAKPIETYESIRNIISAFRPSTSVANSFTHLKDS